jgi:biopolymer transport protein ExbB/TolQ
MPPVGAGEGGSLIGSAVGLLIHLGLVYALVSWGRRVAERRKTRAWRIASYLPIVAFCSSVVGLAGTIVGLIRAFGATANADASHRAEILADGIQVAMFSTAIGLGLALLLYAGCVIAFLYGTYGPRPN